MQTEERNSTTVHAWIEAFNTHNVSAIVSLYADDAELFDSGMKRPRRGHAEIEQWFTTRFRSVPTITYTPSGELITEGHAAVIWTTHGQSPRLLGMPFLSRPFRVDGVSIFTLRDGLIHKQRGYYDHLALVQQVVPPYKWLVPPRF